MPKRKTIIRTPFPDPWDVAQESGISRRRFEELMDMLDKAAPDTAHLRTHPPKAKRSAKKAARPARKASRD